MSGLSKISGLPQMKVAWLIATGPEALKQQAIARLEMIADTYLSMNTPMQLALPVLLELRHNFQQQCIARTRNNLAQLDKLLASQKLCTRLNLEGGWYAVVKVPVTGSDEDLALELLNTRGVYVHPGHFYDFPADGYLVVSLITPELPFATGIAGFSCLDRREIQERFLRCASRNGEPRFSRSSIQCSSGMSMNTSTTLGSNCVPEQRLISPRACDSGRALR